MSVPTAAIVQSMQRASALLQAGNFQLARTTLEKVIQTSPRFVEAYRLLAGALLALGDSRAAEISLRQALSFDAAWIPTQVALGELLANTGRAAEAESLLRNVVASGRAEPRTVLALAVLLNNAKRHSEVIELTNDAARKTQPNLDLLSQRALALSALGLFDEATQILRSVANAVPESAIAELNLARTLDDAGDHVSAEASARRARSKGVATPDATYLHARTLIASGRYDEAEAALRETLRADALHSDAQQNLAQLIWMRSGQIQAASEFLDASLLQFPEAETLHMQKADLLLSAGDDPVAAHAWIAGRADSPVASTPLLLCAAQSALKFDATLALGYAQRALRTAPGDAIAKRVLIEALLGIGAPEEALKLIEQQKSERVDDQYLIALQTVAWRLIGDSRYAQVCDYAVMAQGYTIETPTGWSSLESYLLDLATSLKQMHSLHSHPLHQSLRHGSQTPQNLLRSEDPVIKAFFSAIDEPIRRHLRTIGHGDDPLRRRSPGSGELYRIKGIWSVRLRAPGFHTNHVHPAGWLSSACYIELPQATLASTMPESGSVQLDLHEQRQGWLKFGEPGIATLPKLEPEYFMQPEPGLLALFPSYFWHGTVPFRGDDSRLTIAFDVIPGI